MSKATKMKSTRCLLQSVKLQRILALVAAFTLAALLGRAAQRLGELTFARVKAATLDGAHLGEPISRPLTINEAASSFAFLSSVGGVAFGGTAQPMTGFTFLSVSYTEQNDPGERVEVVLTSPSGYQQHVKAKLYDWQLAPIVRFVESDTFAC